MFLALFCVLAGTLSNCSEDSGNDPVIRYIRVTNPAASDSLLVSAYQGQMVAIMGENLQKARELWFNDQRAVLTTTFITSSSIIASVPPSLPEAITNQLKLVFADGKTLLYDFSVDVSEPVVSRLKSEYVNTGEVATFYGDYFYEPLEVTFTGGAVGEVVSVEDQILEVRIPDGVQPGPVTITNNFGEVVTDFWFRDDRNIIASYDIPLANGVWHGPAFIKSSDPDISNVDEKFIRINQDLGAWAWFEMYVGTADGDIATELKNIPEDAFENPEDYDLKFELNTLAPLTGANIRIYIGPDMPGERGNRYYVWLPNINTDGEWETVSIPWQDIYVANKEFVYNPNGYGISMHFSGPNAVDADFGMDNMRVVPRVTVEE